jgi:hypothetical protein
MTGATYAFLFMIPPRELLLSMHSTSFLPQSVERVPRKSRPLALAQKKLFDVRMKSRFSSFAVAVCFVSTIGFAQTPPTPPPLIPASESPLIQRCFGVPSVYIAPRYGLGFSPIGLPVTPPVPTPPPSSNSSNSSSSGGLSDAKAFLVLAVVAIAVAPVIVYAIDDDAGPLVQQRFQCPSFSIEAFGAGQTSSAWRDQLLPSFSLRTLFGIGHFGADYFFEISPGGINTHAAHLSLRFTPKEHIEASVSVGFRMNSANGQIRDGVEFGVPHEYFFWRDGLTSLGVELRPTLLVGARGVDAALETYLVSRPHELIQIKVGGRVMSFGEPLVWSFNGGVAFTF